VSTLAFCCSGTDIRRSSLSQQLQRSFQADETEEIKEVWDIVDQ